MGEYWESAPSGPGTAGSAERTRLHPPGRLRPASQSASPLGALLLLLEGRAGGPSTQQGPHCGSPSRPHWPQQSPPAGAPLVEAPQGPTGPPPSLAGHTPRLPAGHGGRRRQQAYGSLLLPKTNEDTRAHTPGDQVPCLPDGLTSLSTTPSASLHRPQG